MNPIEQYREALLEALARVETDLDRSPPDVHGARRTLKRARALVRLGTRAWNDSETPRRLRRLLRDAGRSVSGARDAEAVVEALNRVLHRDVPPHDADATALLRDRLVWVREEVHREGGGTWAAAARGHELAGRARDLLSKNPPEAETVEAFEPGLRTITKRGRAALERVRAAPEEPGPHHDLRKRAKDLRHALEFLAPGWPTVLNAWTSELHRLTDQLGEGNDLTVVIDLLANRPGLHPGLELPPVVAALSDVRRARWGAAHILAGRIWAPSPAEFAADVIVWAGSPRDGLPPLP